MNITEQKIHDDCMLLSSGYVVEVARTVSVDDDFDRIRTFYRLCKTEILDFDKDSIKSNGFKFNSIKSMVLTIFVIILLV